MLILVTECQIAGVRTENGEMIKSDTVVLTTGTFLGGLIHLGSERTPAGRVGEAPSLPKQRLREMRLPVGRLKTGHPHDLTDAQSIGHG